MNKNKATKTDLFSILKVCFQLLLQSISFKTLLIFVTLSVAASILPSIIIYLNKAIIDAIERFANGKLSLKYALIFVLIYSVSALILAGIGYLRDSIAASSFALTSDQLQENIMRKSARIQLSYYDDISFRTKSNFSANDLPTRVNGLVTSSLQLITDAITIVSVFVTLFTLNVPLACLLMLGFIPLALVIFAQGRANFHFLEENYQNEAKTFYLHTTTYRRYHLFTSRYFGLQKYVTKKWQDLIQETNNKRSKMVLRYCVYQLIANSFLYISIGLGLITVINAVLAGTDTIGSIALVLTSVSTLTLTITSFLEKIGVIEQNAEYIHSYQDLLTLEDEHPGTKQLSTNLDINFDHVNFTYPHSTKRVLHDINLTIKQGEKIAIVGDNGSGKSTFVSLLSGFYPIETGTITVNGIPIDECLADFRKKTACLYQNCSSYIMSVRENVVIGDTDRTITTEELCELGRLSGMSNFVDTFKNGYDTIIGNLSTNNTFTLSGGQQQKMFLARALARKDARLLILDEPTAALDPIAEAELYENFTKLAGDRTCILISHRLGATKLVDRILVFRDGQIIEEGTHNDLMNTTSYYKEMYVAQAQWYQNRH